MSEQDAIETGIALALLGYSAEDVTAFIRAATESKPL